MDENVAIYRRYFECQTFSIRYQQTIVDRRKNKKKSINIDDISPIYWLWPDISESKSVKIAVVQKKTKKTKKTKKNHFGQYIGPIADFLR